MKKQMHLAAQYLATAGISFLDKKDDDSHTNLGFNIENSCLETHLLSENNDQLLLSYENFSLILKSNSGRVAFELNGATHKEIVTWIKETAQTFLNKEYNYALHYELPYLIEDSFVYELTDAKELRALMQLRILIQMSLEKINESYQLSTSIRIWPHHFDTGIYAALPNSTNSVGQGLAIPDGVCDEHYLYASGYDKDGQIDTSKFNKLSKGYWSNEGFIGAVLPASQITESEAVDFFNETINQYR